MVSKINLADSALDLKADLLRRTIARSNNMQLVKARGDCLAPLISDGEKVEIITSKKLPAVGSIVLVLTDQGLRMHRMYSYTDTHLITKSDNTLDFDSPTPLNRLIATAKSVIKNDGSVHEIESDFQEHETGVIAHAIRSIPKNINSIYIGGIGSPKTRFVLGNYKSQVAFIKGEPIAETPVFTREKIVNSFQVSEIPEYCYSSLIFLDGDSDLPVSILIKKYNVVQVLMEKPKTPPIIQHIEAFGNWSVSYSWIRC